MSAIEWRKVLQWGLGTIALLVFGSAGLVWQLRLGVDAELRTGRERVARLRGELARSAQLGEVAAAASDGSQHTFRLLDGPEVVETLQALRALADGAGVTIDEQHALGASEPGKQPFTVAGRGAPQAVCRFLAAIESSARLTIVESARFAAGDEQHLAFTIGLATYHRQGAR